MHTTGLGTFINDKQKKKKKKFPTELNKYLSCTTIVGFWIKISSLQTEVF